MFLSIATFALSNWRAVLVVVAIISLAGFAVYERSHFISEGAQKERAAIQKANDDEQRKADAAAKAVTDCAAVGGMWDRADGVCLGPTSR